MDLEYTPEQERLRAEILAAYLADNTKARLLQPDGEYVRAPRVGPAFSAQDFLMSLAEGKSPAALPSPAEPRKRRVLAGRQR